MFFDKTSWNRPMERKRSNHRQLSRRKNRCSCIFAKYRIEMTIYIESFDVEKWHYNVFEENKVKEHFKAMKLANDLDVCKAMSLISIAILSRWPGMVMIFTALITMAYGFQEEDPQQGWRTKAERRDWLKKRVREREMRRERKLRRLSQVVRRRQAQVMMLFMVVGTAQSMETQQMLQHIARLAEAANTAVPHRP